MKNHTQIEAIKRIREEYPAMPQRTLARMVSEFSGFGPHKYPWLPLSIKQAVCRCTRRFATNYNRIRRIDGSIK